MRTSTVLMGAAGALLLAIVLAAAPHVMAQGAVTTAGQPQGISVVGEGVVTATPDVARVTLGVEVTNVQLQAAQADAAARMEAVIQRLRAAGIRDEDVRTVSYTVEPQYDGRGEGAPTLRGYRVQNLVSVRVSDLPNLGRLLDDVVASGATRIFGIQLDVSDPSGLRAQARDAALRDARTKAEQLAGGTGVSLGRPLYVEDVAGGPVTPVEARADVATLAAGAPPTPIQPGRTELRATVRVIWSMQ